MALPLPQPPSEREREDASFAYIVSVAIAVVGSPLPVLNLLGCLLYYLSLRKKSFFVRFHALQGLLSQVIAAGLGMVIVFWLFRILFTDTAMSASFLAFATMGAIVAVLDTAISIYAGVQANKGKLFRIEFIGYLTQWLLYPAYQRMLAEALAAEQSAGLAATEPLSDTPPILPPL